MAWTKRDFITQAFEEAGLGSYVFDLTPEQLLGLSAAIFTKRR
jgi:hypothetical protein